MTTPQQLTTRLVSSPLEFEALESSWNQLYESLGNVTVFSSWDWLYTWWEVYAECDLRDLFILCFYDAGLLVGIAPFQIERKYPHTYIQGRTLRFLASGECLKDNVATPFVDLLALPEQQEAVIKSLELALHEYRNRWDFAEFDFLLEDALVFRCFAKSKSIHQQRYSNGFRYEVPTVPDREAYLDTLPRRWRKDFNKKDRVLNNNGEVSVRQSSLETLDPSMDLLQAMHRDRWQSRASFLVFESEHFDRFHRGILKRLIPKNKAYIKTLYINDEPLSCYYAFEDKNQIHYYQSAFYGKNANRYMPLFYLVCNQIGQAMEQGKRYDFMFDDNPDSYKKHQYSAGSKPMYRLIWTASRYRLTVFNLYKKYKRVKQKMIQQSVKNKSLLTGNKKMKIVHVIEPMEHGVFIWVIDMANNLVENGYDVTVIHSLREATPENWRELFDPRVKLIHIQMGRAINPVTDVKALFKITRELKRIHPDAIHGHSSKSGVLARVAGFLLRQNKRTIYTSHAIHYPLIEQPFKRSIYKLLELVSYWMGGTIVACSKREYDIILEEITNNNTARLKCISNGIDLSQIQAKDYSIQKPADEKIRIGVLGRVSNQKAPWVFASIAKQLLAKHSNVEFIWIGGGEIEDEAPLNEAGVIITGFLGRDAAIEETAKLDIFLQTSLYEGLSLALLEAQAAGIPAVVSNIPGNDEVVQHEQCGYVGNDEAELAAFTERLIQSAALREQLGTGARRYVQDNFSFDAMGDQYKALYHEASIAYVPKTVGVTG